MSLHACAPTVAAPGLRRALRRLAVGVGGGLLVAVGLVLVPLPGPGWLVVATGTSLLATEFPWAAGPAHRLQAALTGVLRRADRLPCGRLLLLVLSVGLTAVPLLR